MNEDADGDGHKLTYNLRFPGQYYDEETGRHYNYFRDYDPATGRYIEADPIGLDGGMNIYAYVGINPVGYSDPYGLVRAGRNRTGVNGGAVAGSINIDLGQCGSTLRQRFFILDGDFGSACEKHDRCYECGNDKAKCDMDFLHNMRSICRSLPDPYDRASCQNRASNFYSAVDYWGDDAWDQAQKNKSSCNCEK